MVRFSLCKRWKTVTWTIRPKYRADKTWQLTEHMITKLNATKKKLSMFSCADQQQENDERTTFTDHHSFVFVSLSRLDYRFWNGFHKWINIVNWKFNSSTRTMSQNSLSGQTLLIPLLNILAVTAELFSVKNFSSICLRNSVRIASFRNTDEFMRRPRLFSPRFVLFQLWAMLVCVCVFVGGWLGEFVCVYVVEW